MSAITLQPIEGESGKYKAKFHFLNIQEGSGLYFIFCDKLYKMWNEFCDRTNGEGGLIEQINKWAKENDVPGTDELYIKRVNNEYLMLLMELTAKEEYQFDMHYGNRLRMSARMDPDQAGEFDIAIVVE